MRKTFFGVSLVALAAALVFRIFGDTANADHQPGQPPHGSHYTLNIIAVPENGRPSDSNDGSGHTIFAPLDEVQGDVDCRIYLTQGPTFDTVDRFCLDGDARFTLPDPDPNNDGIVEYQAWIALAGKPGGGANLTTCKDTDKNGIEDECSTENTFQVTGSRTTGKPQWKNVTRQLLTVCLDLDDNGTCDVREFLFDDALAEYLWTYDNFGNRIAKLRFYPISQDIGFLP